MAKLYLKFEQQVLKEMELTTSVLTIGRLPDNVLQIDNLAVSGHHAKLSWDTDHFVIEDLGSLNGTYVNNQRVGKASLKDGDQLLIGKHVVQFRDEGKQAPPPGPANTVTPTPMLEHTVVLDTKKSQEMIAGMAASGAPAPAGAAPKERTGLLTVMDGKTDQTQYVLTGKMTMIGKSPMASIRLKGFFAPNTAALISRRDNKYFIAASEVKIKIKINGEDSFGQRELKDGDIIEVATIKLAFGFQE
ncbi:MAG TPA: FHA domain-containing protein [Verrucomicrobiae bacterium]|jgi:pSer/pThr/pTyr-binding forkhead associated (FHA) protein|nr:FHA domain-containing protein [Verrucomicrobiae bacterium]